MTKFELLEQDAVDTTVPATPEIDAPVDGTTPDEAVKSDEEEAEEEAE